MRVQPLTRGRFVPRRIRPLLVLRRRPRLWWAVVLSVALLAGWAVASVVDAAEATRRAWGDRTTVLVARHAIEPGDRVEAGDLQRVRFPATLVPDGAIAVLPAEAKAREAIVAGEVIVGRRLAPGGGRGVAALLPAGTRGVAVPVEAGLAPPLAVGDHVDVLVAVAPEAAGDGPPGFVLVSDAPVVAVSDHAVTVAVAEPDAARVAVALGAGAVSLALVAG